jgi:excisionase family DNA binding protein
MTVEDVAELFRLKPSYVYRLTHRKAIPYYKVGNHLRFRREELLNWMEAHRVLPATGRR